MALKGLDVSKFQESSKIDWTKVAANAAFVFIRASDGSNPANEKTLAEKWVAARGAGIVCGAYHLFRPKSDLTEVDAQSDLFLKTFKSAVSVIERGYMPAVLDVEIDGGGVTGSDYLAGVQRWIATVEADSRFSGQKVIIYTRKVFWESLGTPADFTAQPLWVADYSQDPPRIPLPWRSYMFFQYTQTGSIPGIPGNVDLDSFNGEMSDLKALLKV
jgi:lysozyme